MGTLLPSHSLSPPNPPVMWPWGNLWQILLGWSNNDSTGNVSASSACGIWCNQGSVLTDHHGWQERGKEGDGGGKTRRVPCWRPPMTHGWHPLLIFWEEESEDYPTSGNYSPVCWLMIVVMRWSRANRLPAVLLLVRDSIFLSCFHFYTMCNLGEEGMVKVQLR